MQSVSRWMSVTAVALLLAVGPAEAKKKFDPAEVVRKLRSLPKKERAKFVKNLSPAERRQLREYYQKQRKNRSRGGNSRYAAARLTFDEKAFDTTPTFEDVQPKANAYAYSDLIDDRIDDVLKEEGMDASPTCTDAEFIRRAYLDITGVIPPPGKVAAFLDSRVTDKRARLIDELLASDGYARRMADVWTELMFQRTTDNRRIKTGPLTEWLQARFAKNESWDKMVSDVLTASGNQKENGAVTYFLGNYRVDRMTDSATRLFLGVRLECAQCHDHPFTDYKQDEYWHMAKFFMKVRMIRANNRALRDGAVPGIQEAPRVYRNKRFLPEDAKDLDAKFLRGETPDLAEREPYRPALAEWLTSPQNPYFAKAAVNRVWRQFFGRGIVMPVDDMHDDNPATHPEMLKGLAGEFAKDFDVKRLIRGICNSKAYQRSSKPHGNNAKDTELFSRMAIKVMSPQQLYDSLQRATGEPMKKSEAARKKKAKGRYQITARDRFVDFFRSGDESDPLKYEAGIPQALQLMNSPFYTNSARYVPLMVKPNMSAAKAVENLYLATVSRRPTRDELITMNAYLRKQKEPYQALGDILWALMNSSEFTLNR